MGWVKDALRELQQTGICHIRPIGGSMRGKIESGQLVTLKKIQPEEVEIEDVIFVKWKNNYLLHLAKKISENDILIGNNIGKINGWIPKENVIAKVILIHELDFQKSHVNESLKK